MDRRRFYMPALLDERSETREGGSWTVRVFEPVGKGDLLADGSGFRKRRPGAVLVTREVLLER
jgi:hypothetical protein